MLPAPSLVRNPSQYDDTASSVDNLQDIYRAIALDELRETPQVKEQALAQLRDWIAKHPAIKSCRTDAGFLLKFLRVRKYGHVTTCENLERYLVMRQSIPRWFGKLDTSEPWVSDVIDAGPILPLGYDPNGKLLTLVKIGYFDPKKYSNQHFVRFWTMILDSYQEEAEMQIAGGSAVFDMEGFTMAHIAQWPVTDLHRYVSYMINTTPMRIKGIHLVNIPKYAVSFAELIISFFNAKQKSRTHFHKSFDEYTKCYDATVLPKEYDARGRFTLDELKDQLRKRLARYRDVIYEQSTTEIDQTMCKPLQKQDVEHDTGFGVDGSFRKLNLD
ncbi:alpha-tocopherol transfer protein-like [Ochlerotatus camptorhynchus]|uniref:alpha-tocopherol transfer protein-like n=1 Tax=Ochlerotatus camptorhynchus TaxID=644619 RepID=UPI0031D6C271